MPRLIAACLWLACLLANGSVFAGETLEDSALAYFRFDGEAKNHGQGQATLTLRNTTYDEHALSLNGRPGRTPEEDGSSTLCEIPQLKFDSFTAAVRFKAKSFAKDSSILLGWGIQPCWFSLRRAPTGRLAVTFNDREQEHEIADSYVPAGSWTIVACAVNVPGRKVVVFLDGKKADESELPQDFKFKETGPEDREHRTGWTFTNQPDPNTFQGLIGELAIYDKALSEKELGRLLSPEKWRGAPRSFSAEERQLLLDMRSENFDERDNAVRKLNERVDELRELLAAEANKPGLDADYRHSLTEILARAKAGDAMKAFDNPPRKTLEWNDLTLEDAAKEFSKVYGYSLVIPDDAAKDKLKLSLKDATFMEALDAFMKASKMSLDFNENEQKEPSVLRAMRLSRTPAPPTAVSPMVMVDLRSITRSRTVSFGQEQLNQARDSMQLQGSIIIAPGSNFSQIELQAATATSGGNPVFEMSTPSVNQNDGRANSIEYHVLSFYGNTEAQEVNVKTADIKIRMKVKIPVRTSQFSIDKLGTHIGQKWTVFGDDLTLINCVAEENQTTLDLAVSGRLYNRCFESAQQSGENPGLCRLSYVDTDGKVAYAANESDEANETGTHFIKVKANGKLDKVVLRNFIETQERELEFNFAKVPIP